MEIIYFRQYGRQSFLTKYPCIGYPRNFLSVFEFHFLLNVNNVTTPTMDCSLFSEIKKGIKTLSPLWDDIDRGDLHPSWLQESVWSHLTRPLSSSQLWCLVLLAVPHDFEQRDQFDQLNTSKIILLIWILIQLFIIYRNNYLECNQFFDLVILNRVHLGKLYIYLFDFSHSRILTSSPMAHRLKNCQSGRLLL